jgi:hypothetical protein
MAENSFTISVSNTFDAESPEDAIMQMICWLQESAHCAGYRVEWESVVSDMFRTHSVFIDAEAMIRSKVDY